MESRGAQPHSNHHKSAKYNIKLLHLTCGYHLQPEKEKCLIQSSQLQ